jgi:hypothetical protein
MYAAGLGCTLGSDEKHLEKAFGTAFPDMGRVVLCDPASMARKASKCARCFLHLKPQMTRKMAKWTTTIKNHLASGDTVILTGMSNGGLVVGMIVMALERSGAVGMSRLHAMTCGSIYIPDRADVPSGRLTHVMGVGDVATRCTRSMLTKGRKLLARWRDLRAEHGSELFDPDGHSYLRWYVPAESVSDVEMDRIAKLQRAYMQSTISSEMRVHLHKDNMSLVKQFVVGVQASLGTVDQSQPRPDDQ